MPAQLAAADRAAPSPEKAAWAKVVEAAQKEGVLIIYGSSQIARSMGEAVARAFKNRYGIGVEILVGPGRQTVERVKLEHRLNMPVADVAIVGTSNSMELREANLADKVWHELPSFKDMSVFVADPRFDPEGFTLFIVFGLAGPLINTNLVKPQDEPRSSVDYLDPKWKKKIILETPFGGGGGFTWFSTMRALKVLDDDYFRHFANMEPQIWGGSPVVEYKMIARGEYALTPYATTGSVGHLILEGAPLKLLGMKDGNIAQGNPLNVIKGAPHPNAARLFADWMFSPEGQTVYTKAGGMTSARKDVPDFLDPRVKLTPEPGRILVRDWQMAEETNRIQKAGIAESIFGKK